MVVSRPLRLSVGLRPRLACALIAAAAALAVPQAASAQPGCAREVDGVFWGGTQWLELSQALAASPSPCADYSVSLSPAVLSDQTVLRLRPRFDEVRALGVHPVAEIRWTSSTGWRAWVVGPHPTWAPGRTFYEAGMEARRRMAARGLNVEAGETWAFNEVTAEVLAGEPGARAEVLEFMRGLYDGLPGMPKARGIVFNIWVPSTTEEAGVEAYKADLKAWLADEAFWTELDRYVDVFARDVYVSALSWGVSGATLAKRAKRMNDYFQHMAVLANDGPKEIQAARAFLQRTYVPLANAFWPHTGVGDTHLLSADLMSHFVSTQVYALRQFAEAYPRIVPQNLIGFGWAPIDFFPGYTEAGRNQIAARLASAIRDSLVSPKDACGVPERIWCEGEVPGAEFATQWRIFDSWE
jgi:hypothetical protein